MSAERLGEPVAVEPNRSGRLRNIPFVGDQEWGRDDGRAGRSGPRIGSLFSGYGGLDLGVQSVLGGTLLWHAEIDPDASRVLAEHWPDVPNLGDISTVDWSLVDPVDVLTGGFPCQDVSSAGKRAGLRPGTRSGLWSQMAYAVSVLRPRLVVAENVRGLLSAPAASDVEPCPWCLGDDTDHALRALGAVLGDLADLGYRTAWCGLRASDVGAPHARFRVFVAAADTDRPRPQRTEPTARLDVPARDTVADSEGERHRDSRQASERGLSAPTVAGDQRSVVAHSARDGHRDTGTSRGRGIQSTSVAGDQRGIATDSDSVRPVRAGAARRRGRGPADNGASAADSAHGDEAHEYSVGTASGGTGRGVRAESGTGVGTRRGDSPARVPDLGAGSGRVDFGGYEPAIRRWEHILGRPAPAPTIGGKRAARVLNPQFVEWMQGTPAGWVTDVPGLSRNAMLRILGNGVVPGQAAAALPWLLAALGGAA